MTHYVQETVLNNNEVHLVRDINNYYEALLHQIGKEKGHDFKYSTQKLEVKLIKYFGEKVKILKGIKGRGSILFSASIDVQVVRKQQSDKTSADTELKTCHKNGHTIRFAGICDWPRLTGLVADARKLRRLSCSQDDYVIYFLPVAATSSSLKI